MHDQRRAVRPDQRSERGGDGRGGEDVAGQVDDRVVVGDRQPGQRAARLGVPARLERDAPARGRERGEPRRGGGRVAERVDLDVEGGDLGLGHRVAERLEEAGPEGPELELLEQDPGRLPVEGGRAEVGGAEPDVDVAAQDRHLAVQHDPVAQLVEVLALLGGQLVEMVEDPLDRPVGGDELGGGLLPDPGDAGQVVAGVAPQRRVVGVLLGGHAAGALHDAGLVVERVVGDAPLVVEDPDVGVVDELERVAVAGDDDDVDAGLVGLGGQGRDDVVGFHPVDGEDGEVQRVEDLPDQRQLRREDRRGLLAARLVLGVHRVAKRGPRRCRTPPRRSRGARRRGPW